MSAKRLRQLEEEKRRLKQMVADLSLDNQALKEVARKKMLSSIELRHVDRASPIDAVVRP
jgi:cell division protein FtsB